MQQTSAAPPSYCFRAGRKTLQKIRGAQPYSAFKSAIDAALEDMAKPLTHYRRLPRLEFVPMISYTK